MSNPMSNAPMMSAGSTSIFQTWINALTKPNEQTFSDIASSPNAKATTAFIWIFVGALIQAFCTTLVQGSLINSIRPLLEKYGLGSNIPDVGGGGILFRLVCGAPIQAVIVVVITAIGIAIVQGIAKMFGGKGSFSHLAIAFGAILAPVYLISSVLSLLSAIPLIGLCFSIFSFLLSIYLIVLEVIAVKGINQFGWGPAIGSILIPLIVLIIIPICIIAILMILGPVIGNTFSTINSSLNQP